VEACGDRVFEALVTVEEDCAWSTVETNRLVGEELESLDVRRENEVSDC